MSRKFKMTSIARLMINDKNSCSVAVQTLIFAHSSKRQHCTQKLLANADRVVSSGREFF